MDMLFTEFVSGFRRPSACFSRAKAVLESIRVAIDEGCSARLLQKTPHVVLLSRKFYHEKLMPLLAQWVLLWMRQRRLREVSDEVRVWGVLAFFCMAVVVAGSLRKQKCQ